MKCSISAGHSCNAVRVAIIQNGGQTLEGQGGCLVLPGSHPPSASNRAQPLDPCDVPEWRGWVPHPCLALLWGSMNADTSWDEINYSPEVLVVNSRFTRDTCHSCLSLPALQPSLKWVPSSSPSIKRMFHSLLCFFGNMYWRAVSQLRTECHCKWQLVPCPPPKSPNLTVYFTNCLAKGCFHNISPSVLLFSCQGFNGINFHSFFSGYINSNYSWKGISPPIQCILLGVYCTFRSL